MNVYYTIKYQLLFVKLYVVSFIDFNGFIGFVLNVKSSDFGIDDNTVVDKLTP